MAVDLEPKRLTQPNRPQSPQILVIGYGNTLRSDDGVGYRIAETVSSWRLQGIEGWPCQQLTPELAAAIAPVQQVIFVDAAIATSTTVPLVTCKRLQPDSDSTFTTHTAIPAALLGLTQWLYEVAPIAHQLAIPAVNFDLGETLSPIAQVGQTQALEQLKGLCQNVSFFERSCS